MIVTKEIKTSKKEEFIDITDIIEKELSKHNIEEGTLVVFVPHTTAAVTINENADPSVMRDISSGIRSLGLDSQNYMHGEGNSPSHIRSSLFGPSLTIIINNSRLLLGTWQGVYFCEFDGPRNRKFIIKF